MYDFDGFGHGIFISDLNQSQASITLHTNVLPSKMSDDHFEKLYQIVKTGKVIDLIFDHDLDASKDELWSLRPWQLNALIDQGILISSLSANCLDINDENVTEFIKLLSHLKECKIEITNFYYERYKFTVKDFELMVKEDVRVTQITSDALEVDGDSSNLEFFIPVLKQLEYLEEFSFRTTLENGPAPIHLFTDFPIESIETSEFELQEDTIDQVIEILDQIECEVLVWSPVWNDYLLSPEDLLKFEHLPLGDVDMKALDLTEENIPDFRKVIKRIES